MTMATLKSIHIQGFKSIRDARVDLGRVNVLIGANASGKSNLVAFFRLVRAIVDGKLQFHVAKRGGPEALLRFGPKVTPELAGAIDVVGADNLTYAYRFVLEATAGNGFVFTSDEYLWPNFVGDTTFPFRSEPGGSETRIELRNNSQVKTPTQNDVAALYRTFEDFQFHDTSDSSSMRIGGYIGDNQRLNRDGSNLAAVLHKFAKVKPAYYRRIVATVRQVFPQFDDFVLEPDALAPTQIKLNWRERGQDNLFGPHQFSDGTLRFIALATLLLQPEEELPKVIVIDEPELGLHPNAITVLAALIHKASHHSQLVVATQSVTLLDQFDPEEVIVVERDRVHNATEFRRLDAPSLAGWLEEYTLGDLWRKNVIGGGPH